MEDKEDSSTEQRAILLKEMEHSWTTALGVHHQVATVGCALKIPQGTDIFLTVAGSVYKEKTKEDFQMPF